MKPVRTSLCLLSDGQVPPLVSTPERQPSSVLLSSSLSPLRSKPRTLSLELGSLLRLWCVGPPLPHLPGLPPDFAIPESSSLSRPHPHLPHIKLFRFCGALAQVAFISISTYQTPAGPLNADITYSQMFCFPLHICGGGSLCPVFSGDHRDPDMALNGLPGSHVFTLKAEQ